MYERLLLIKELMAETSSIYLHCDWRRTGQLRVVMDEVFGADNFVNEVVWHFPNKIQGNVNRFATNHNSLLLFAKSKADFQFRRIEEERDRPIRVNRRYWDAVTGRFATLRDAEGRVLYAERRERVVDDVWTIAAVSSDENKQVDYPTQKPDELLERVVIASTIPGDLVLDCFVGSGTTAAVAQKLGRRWIAADINKGAIQTTEKRLVGVIEEQLAMAAVGEQLVVDGADAPPRPAQLAFSVHRVNDYDLQVQHNEAVELAVEHLGVERTRADRFFHGTRGRDLVYIVPFDHPATLLDLQAVADELAARPGEERGVLVVGLGRELSCSGWLERWNQHRPVNRITLVDLRTDARHGHFFEHRPAEARVAFERTDGHVRVQVEDVISPSIMERLARQEGVVAPQITDWRWVVDSVAIDASYDGTALEIALFDVPERRQDLVVGEYDVAVPDGSPDPVAVRLTDMLGEEILIVEPRDSA